MLKNYLTIAIRNLLRNKAFSLINVSGLVLGMTSSLLILLWVWDEQGIDAYHKNNSRIYSIYESIRDESGMYGSQGYYTPGLLPEELKLKIPEIRYASGYFPDLTPYFKLGDKIVKVNGGYAGADFFKIFSYKLLKGNAASALAEVSDIAISRKMAENFFGSVDAAFGKTVQLKNLTAFRVSTIFENLPANTSRKFDFLINWKFCLDSIKWLNNFTWVSPNTFLLLNPRANPDLVKAKIKQFLTPYNTTGDGKGLIFELGMVRFDKMYLNNNFENGKPSGGRTAYVNIFTSVALFVLLIACINFMNLATARSVKRAKEVGIRKTIGAVRSKLIIQFLSEAMLISLLSAIISILLINLVLPEFNLLTGKQITLPVLQSSFSLMVMLVVMTTGLISGSYPALFLSSLNPIKVLKGTLKFSVSAVWFRKGLVVFQFTLSIALIVGAIIVARQINYIQTKDLGFNKENLVCIPMKGTMKAKYDVLKDQLLQLPGMKSITFGPLMTDIEKGWAIDFYWTGKDQKVKTPANFERVGYDYIKTAGLTLIKGRDFSRDLPSDTSGFIINEKASNMTGYKDPIGQPLTVYGKKAKIIGLVKDFNYSSLHSPIEPLIIEFNNADEDKYILIRTQPGKTRQAIAGMEKVCKQLNPEYPFTYEFADEDYGKLYQNEQFIGKLSDGFAMLAILISCLGLLGLAMFTAQQRTKEIGIRKVLGASTADIAGMFSKDILKLVFISVLIASPFAFLAMNQWLQHFAYRIAIDPWLFVVAGLFALFIALGTISYQAINAAVANPVKSLKTE
jgi:putative ABC transport system permease protein